MSTADRLRDARIAAGFDTIREFQRLLPQETAGASYSSVSKYERGIAEPPKPFLRAASSLLGVTEQWLRTGVGPRTIGEEDTSRLREIQEKATLSEALWVLSEEVLEAYTQIPGPARRLIQDLIFDLYYQRGPRAFGLPWEGEWRGHDSARAAFPEILIDADDVHAYLEDRLQAVLFESSQASYGEHVAEWLAALSILYLREFGSRP